MKMWYSRNSGWKHCKSITESVHTWHCIAVVGTRVAGAVIAILSFSLGLILNIIYVEIRDKHNSSTTTYRYYGVSQSSCKSPKYGKITFGRFGLPYVLYDSQVMVLFRFSYQYQHKVNNYQLENSILIAFTVDFDFWFTNLKSFWNTTKRGTCNKYLGFFLKFASSAQMGRICLAFLFIWDCKPIQMVLNYYF